MTDRDAVQDNSETPRRASLGFMLEHPAHVLALSGGAGLSPLWPGTAGSLVGFPLFFALQLAPTYGRVAIYIALIAIGVWCCGVASRALGRPDPGAVTWDETVCMSLVLEATPFSLPYWVLAFLLFRLFDGAKPWPIRLLNVESHSGVFIMIDDIAAAAAAALSVVLIARYLPLAAIGL